MAGKNAIRISMRVGMGAAALVAAAAWGIGAIREPGAVVASGSVVADPNVRKVQHPTGGILSEVRFRNGDRVTAGDVVARLDEAATRTSLSFAAKGLDELGAQKARLEAERDGTGELSFPENLLSRANEPEIARVFARERRLFELRRAARTGEVDQLRERITRLDEEIGAYAVQARAKKNELSLVEEELKGARNLRDKSLVPITRLTGLERDAVRLDGEQRGQLVATVAQARGRIAELKLQVMQVERDRAFEVSRELWDTEARLAELAQRKLAAEDQLRRADIRAPQNGVVEDSERTVGSIVAAGEEIMRIVPQHPSPLIEARIPASEVGRMQVGQSAVLEIPRLKKDSPSRIRGRLDGIAPEGAADRRSGEVYFTARVVVPPEEAARLGLANLVPGTPVEVSVEKEERETMSAIVMPLVHLAKPLGERLARAF